MESKKTKDRPITLITSDKEFDSVIKRINKLRKTLVSNGGLILIIDDDGWMDISNMPVRKLEIFFKNYLKYIKEETLN